MNLDDPQVYQQYDREGMLVRLREMPRLCQQAWQLAMKFNLPQDYRQVDKVVILGMGGSAIGGDLVRSLLIAEARLPILVHRGYDLPAFVDARTLVIASSYSGTTEETIASFEKALGTEAKKLLITTGGRLKTIAEERNIPVFSFDYSAQPRAALPFSLLPIIYWLQKLGFIGDRSADVAETARVLEKLSREIKEDASLSHNPAKQLAQRLYRHLPVIYGAGIVSQVAHRWKTQLNENSKAWAFYEAFPELDHNAVVGYRFPEELASKITVVLLRSSHLAERIQHRYQITCQLLKQAEVDYQIVDGIGDSPLCQMMSLVLFGDYLSCYLAMLYRIDPSPVPAIDNLKEQLAQHKRSR
jgi:glucose/mannose-6-phosphate isomerase